jgi:hypothetical protein
MIFFFFQDIGFKNHLSPASDISFRFGALGNACSLNVKKQAVKRKCFH